MTTKKIYAKQVPPEYAMCDFGFYFDESVERFAISGNNHLKGYFDDEVKKAKKLCDDMEYDYLPDYILKNDGKAMSEAQLNELNEIAHKDASWSEIEEEFVLKYLELFYGEEYETYTIRGCCQGDWNILYAPKSMTEEERSFIEALYFNTGTEVIIHDEDNEPKDASEINGYSVYFAEEIDFQLKQKIAEETGVSPEDVVLYLFDGYEKIEKYSIA